MMSHQAPGQHQYQSIFSARNGIAISPVAHRSLCSRLANCPGSVGCVRYARAILWLPLGIGMVRSISESAANLRSLVGALLKPLVSHLLKPLNCSLGTASFHAPKVSWRRQKSSSPSVPWVMNRQVVKAGRAARQPALAFFSGSPKASRTKSPVNIFQLKKPKRYCNICHMYCAFSYWIWQVPFCMFTAAELLCPPIPGLPPTHISGMAVSSRSARSARPCQSSFLSPPKGRSTPHLGPKSWSFAWFQGDPEIPSTRICYIGFCKMVESLI